MAYFRNPMFQAEPFEESQGNSSKSPASPDDLKAFYQDMERKEIIERKLSKRKSGSGTSIWSRKSVRKSATAQPIPTPVARSQPPPPPVETHPVHENRRRDEEKVKERVEEQKEKRDSLPLMNMPRSIIPDPLRDLPAWYNKEEWAAVPLPSHKMRFPLHNPLGPKWYRNYHLIPPSQMRPAARPPSVFSPSFPPMASASLQERSEDATRMLGPSRTPSNSPLPTPNSSQTGVEDAGKPRSRKTSQTAHDNVDLLDVTDPWGTNWHHQSPYDIGLSNGPVSVDVQEGPNNSRSRPSSTTTGQNRSKTVNPSPLSQSTSAIHLEIPDVSGAHLPRKLSKRRSRNDNTTESQRNTVSLPATPIDHSTLPQSSKVSDSADLPKRMSTLPPPSAFQSHSSPRKERRTSVLGRLAKRFSILRKSTQDPRRISRREEDWHHVDADDAKSDRNLRRSAVMGRQPSPEKAQMDMKRISPPSIEPNTSTTHNHNTGVTRAADRSSEASLETPYSMGRLTIANPDAPRSENSTPVQRDGPLPPLKFDSSPEISDRRSEEQPRPAVVPVANSPPTSSVSPQQSPIPTSPPVASSSGGRDRAPSETQLPVLHTEKAQPVSQAPSQSPTPTSPQLTTASSSRGTNQVPLPERPTERTRNKPLAPSKSKVGSSTSAVPFPAPEMALASQAPTSVSVPTAIQPWNNSPLSTSSMLVNPPTPYTNDIPMPMSDFPPAVQVTGFPEGKRSSRDPSPGGQAGAGRQTETFKLIRSSSGHIYASGQTISAAGEQWEVVESKRKNGKERPSKSKDRDSGSRRENKRHEKTKADTDTEVDQRPVRSQRSQRQQTTGPAPSSSASVLPRASSLDTRHRRPVPESMPSRQEEPKTNRRRDADRNRKSDRKSTDARPSTVLNVNKPQPPRPPPTPGPPDARPLERQPSTSARPTSELPSSAELNALRAREAWEMERLWKARSMYGIEPNGMSSAPTHIGSSTGAFPVAKNTGDPPAHAAAHGSSHTSFMVQTPFQGQPSHIYHSMPAVPPPIIYASSPSLPHTLNHSASIYSYPNAQRSFPNSISSPDALVSSLASRQHLVNPLPEPPRESTYEPSPLPTTMLDSKSGRSAEYRNIGLNTRALLPHIEI